MCYSGFRTADGEKAKWAAHTHARNVTQKADVSQFRPFFLLFLIVKLPKSLFDHSTSDCVPRATLYSEQVESGATIARITLE